MGVDESFRACTNEGMHLLYLPGVVRCFYAVLVILLVL